MELLWEKKINQPLSSHPSFMWLGDGSDLLEDQILTSYMFALNKKYGFLSCIAPSCGYALGKNIYNHYYRLHRKCMLSRDVNHIKSLQAQYPPRKIPKHEAIPIQGLKIVKVYECLACSTPPHCSFSFLNVQRHLLTSHNKGLAGNLQICDAQQLNNQDEKFKVLISSFPFFFPFPLCFFRFLIFPLLWN